MPSNRIVGDAGVGHRDRRRSPSAPSADEIDDLDDDPRPARADPHARARRRALAAAVSEPSTSTRSWPGAGAGRRRRRHHPWPRSPPARWRWSGRPTPPRSRRSTGRRSGRSPTGCRRPAAPPPARRGVRRLRRCGVAGQWIVDPIDGTSGYVREASRCGRRDRPGPIPTGDVVGVVSAPPSAAGDWWGSRRGDVRRWAARAGSRRWTVADAQVSVTLNDGWDDLGLTPAWSASPGRPPARASATSGSTPSSPRAPSTWPIDAVGVAAYDVAAVRRCSSRRPGHVHRPPRRRHPRARHGDQHERPLHAEVLRRLSTAGGLDATGPDIAHLGGREMAGRRHRGASRRRGGGPGGACRRRRAPGRPPRSTDPAATRWPPTPAPATMVTGATEHQQRAPPAPPGDAGRARPTATTAAGRGVDAAVPGRSASTRTPRCRRRCPATTRDPPRSPRRPSPEVGPADGPHGHADDARCACSTRRGRRAAGPGAGGARRPASRRCGRPRRGLVPASSSSTTTVPAPSRRSPGGGGRPKHVTEPLEGAPSAGAGAPPAVRGTARPPPRLRRRPGHASSSKVVREGEGGGGGTVGRGVLT